MSNIPADLKYTESHEWVRAEADGTLTVGITAFAQDALGDIVFVELPKVGNTYTAGDDAAVVESVKAASDIYAPVAGEIVGANADLGGEPQRVNEDAFASWIYRIKPSNAADVDQLLDAAAYEKSAS